MAAHNCGHVRRTVRDLIFCFSICIERFNSNSESAFLRLIRSRDACQYCRSDLARIVSFLSVSVAISSSVLRRIRVTGIPKNRANSLAIRKRTGRPASARLMVVCDSGMLRRQQSLARSCRLISRAWRNSRSRVLSSKTLPRRRWSEAACDEASAVSLPSGWPLGCDRAVSFKTGEVGGAVLSLCLFEFHVISLGLKGSHRHR